MELCDKNDELMMHASCMLYANTGRGASFLCARKKKENREYKGKGSREENGGRRFCPVCL